MAGARSSVPRKKRYAERSLPMVEPLEPRKLLSANVTPVFAALPAALPTGGSDRVVVQLTNTGSSPSRGPVTFSLYASPDGSVGPSATLLASIVKPIRVKAARSVLVPLQFLSPATLPDGSYFLAATVSGRGVASSTIVSSAPVMIVQPFVDLTSRIVQLPASAVETGHRLSRMMVNVMNQGNVTASGKVAIEVYLSIDGHLDATAIPVNVSLPRRVHIPPGSTTRVSVYFSALPDMSPGQYYLLARVNPGRAISEGNVANNLSASAVPVQVVRAQPHHHGFDCYLVVDSYYFTDTYTDTGIVYDGVDYIRPVDTSGDTTAPTTDPTTSPSTDPTTNPSTDPTTSPTTDPTTSPSTDPTPQQGNDPSVGSPSADTTPAPIPDPTTAPSPSDGSSGDTSSSGSFDTGSSDSSGSSDIGSDLLG